MITRTTITRIAISHSSGSEVGLKGGGVTAPELVKLALVPSIGGSVVKA